MATEPKRTPEARLAFGLGIALFVFGAVMPGLLFPNENQLLVGFIGAPFVLFGIILMLIGSFPTQRLRDKDDDKKPPPGEGR